MPLPFVDVEEVVQLLLRIGAADALAVESADLSDKPRILVVDIDIRDKPARRLLAYAGMATQSMAGTATQADLFDLNRQMETIFREIVLCGDDALETRIEKGRMKQIILCRDGLRQTDLAQRFALASAAAFNALKQWPVIQADLTARIVAILA